MSECLPLNVIGCSYLTFSVEDYVGYYTDYYYCVPLGPASATGCHVFNYYNYV